LPLACERLEHSFSCCPFFLASAAQQQWSIGFEVRAKLLVLICSKKEYKHKQRLILARRAKVKFKIKCKSKNTNGGPWFPVPFGCSYL
jgi:hypothetical protein